MWFPKIDKNSNLGFASHLLECAYHFLYLLRLQDFWFDSLHNFVLPLHHSFFPELKINLKIAEKITDGYWKKVLNSSRNDHKNHRAVERISIVRFTPKKGGSILTIFRSLLFVEGPQKIVLAVFPKAFREKERNEDHGSKVRIDWQESNRSDCYR